MWRREDRDRGGGGWEEVRSRSRLVLHNSGLVVLSAEMVLWDYYYFASKDHEQCAQKAWYATKIGISGGELAEPDGLTD